MLCLDEGGGFKVCVYTVNISSAVHLRLLSFACVAESALNVKCLLLLLFFLSKYFYDIRHLQFSTVFHSIFSSGQG